MFEILNDIWNDVRKKSVYWLAFVILFLIIYAIYYYFSPVYIYVVSSDCVKPSIIEGFADAYLPYFNSIMSIEVMDFVIADTEEDVANFVQKVRTDIHEGKRIVAIVGTDLSAETKKLLLELSTRGMNIPVISAVSSSPELAHIYPYFFRIVFNDEMAVSAFARWYVEEGPAKPVIILVDSENIIWSGSVAEIFQNTASNLVLTSTIVDLNDIYKVEEFVQKALLSRELSPSDVYIFVIDHKLQNVLRVIYQLSDNYHNYLLTDAAVVRDFLYWLPDDIDVYAYYLPVPQGADIGELDYGYDLSYDALSLVLNEVSSGARSPWLLATRLINADYNGRTGHISFEYRNGVYERVFSNISILRRDGEKWKVIWYQPTRR